MEQDTKKGRKGNSNKPYRAYLIGVVGLLALAGAGYYGYTYWQANMSSPEAVAEAQAAEADAEKAKILAQLGKLMVLPEGDPVLFKVNDEETMKKQQAFFKDTKNDDVLLVFQESGKAIIFRPSTNVIVNAGPVNFDQNAAATDPKPEAKTQVTTPEKK